MARLLWIFMVLCVLLPRPAHASHAEIMMIPTRVVLENNDRYSTIVIKNVGDASGDFTADLVDMKMLETGMVVPLDQGEAAQYSAIPYIHISPKSMTLKPGETQNVRLMLRKPESMQAGEFRAHLRVKLVHDNTEAPANTSGKDAVIAVKANLVIVIPIIVRNGATNLAMGVDQPRLAHDANGKPSMDMYLTRQGNRSSMGDISITWYPRSGAPQVIKVFRGVSVYRPTARRFVSVPLDETPKGLSLSRGKLGIVYAAQAKEGGTKLAETQLSVQ